MFMVIRHPASVQSLLISIAVGVASSVMSEMIGPDFRGVSAEYMLAEA